MTAQHTPGPWYWTQGGLMDKASEYIMWPDNVPGQVGNDPRSWAELLGACGTYTEPAAEANARLIAAAPDLLEALLGLCEFSEAAGFPTDKARAAIAKATGQEANNG